MLKAGGKVKEDGRKPPRRISTFHSHLLVRPPLRVGFGTQQNSLSGIITQRVWISERCSACEIDYEKSGSMVQLLQRHSKRRVSNFLGNIPARDGRVNEEIDEESGGSGKWIPPARRCTRLRKFVGGQITNGLTLICRSPWFDGVFRNFRVRARCSRELAVSASGP